MEEGDAGESIQPRVKGAVLSQLVLGSSIMGKHDQMEVAKVCAMYHGSGRRLKKRTQWKRSCSLVI